MTTRNRRSRRSRGSQRRTGRNVWVNHDVNEIPVVNTLTTRNLLVNAKDFMLFDTTIVNVIIEDLKWTFTSTSTSGTRRLAIALITGMDTLDAADFSSLYLDDVGPPYMVLLTKTIRVDDAGSLPHNVDITPQGPVVVKAKRRFKENDATLWLIIQQLGPATDPNQELSGIIRTLIHIP